MERFGWTSIFSSFYVEHRLLSDLLSPLKNGVLSPKSDDLGRSFSSERRKNRAFDPERDAEAESTGRLTAVFGFLSPIVVDRGRDEPLQIAHEVRRHDGAAVVWVLRLALSAPRPATPEAVWAHPDVQAYSRELFERERPPAFLVLSTDDVWIVIARRWVAQRGALIIPWLEVEEGSPHDLALRRFLHPTAFAPSDGGTPLLEQLEERAFQHQEGLQRSLRSRIASAIEAIATDVLASLDRADAAAVRATPGHTALQPSSAPSPAPTSPAWPASPAWLASPASPPPRVAPSLAALHAEVLQWLFRVLTLLYLEARSDGGGLPWEEPAFSDGVSLRWLASFTWNEPTTSEAGDGRFLFESVERYLREMHHANIAANNDVIRSANTGATTAANSDANMNASTSAHPQPPLYHNGATTPDAAPDALPDAVPDAAPPRPLAFPAFGGGLFDPSVTPILQRVGIGNRTMLAVLRALMWVEDDSAATSLGGSRGDLVSRRVGANSAGNGWMSYAGFTHEHAATLYQALLNDTLVRVSTPSALIQDRQRRGPVYLVSNEDLDRAGTAVPAHDRLQQVPQDTLLCRPTGSVRERHASFYTPDVLAKRLVRHALDALEDARWRTLAPADRLHAYLDLRICEPALGGAALLCEVLDQLTERYGRDAKEATGTSLSAAARATVRATLASRCLYGVEKHPPTRDFAEWCVRMHAFHPDAPLAPFDGRFHTGDALVGAPRAVWHRSTLCSGLPSAHWEAPQQIGVHPPPPDTCWQFLVPVASMSEVTHARFRTRYDTQVRTLDAWRASMDAPWSADDWATLARLTPQVEAHWRCLANAKAKQHASNGTAPLCKEARDASERLTAIMDAWCALWRWPLGEVDALPTRQEWLAWLTVVVLPVDSAGPWTAACDELGIDADAPLVVPTQRAGAQNNEPSGGVAAPWIEGAAFLDLHFVYSVYPFWDVVEDVRRAAGFFHWGIGFADTLLLRGGFDLILSNPPWARVRWSAADTLFEADPLLAYQRLPLDEVNRHEATWLARHPSLEAQWLEEYQQVQGLHNVLQDPALFPHFEKGQTSLHKYFLTHSWSHTRADGVSSFMYETGVFSEAGASRFRQAAYPRLRRHATVVNGMGLFGLRGNARTSFHLSVFGGPTETIGFAFEPALNLADTHDASVHVDASFLEAAGRFFGDDGPADQAMLPTTLSPASQQLLATVGAWTDRWTAHDDAILLSSMWHETRALAAGLLVRETTTPKTPDAWFITGANIWVANALEKAPKPVCASSHDYETRDLASMPPDFRPPSLYRMGDADKLARRRPPVLPWRRTAAVDRHPADDYRLVVRRMATLTGERTLVAAIVPPGVQSIDTVFSVNVRTSSELLDLAACCASTLFDVMAKMSGRTNISDRWFLSLPRVTLSERSRLRVAALHALTEDYRDLWERAWHPAWAVDELEGAEPTPLWQPACALRTDLARRNARVALDVEVAQAMGVGFEDVRGWVHDHAVRAHEVDASTWYDQRGVMAYQRSRRLADRGLLRRDDEVWVTPRGGAPAYRATAWAQLVALEEGATVRRIDRRTGAVQIFYPPFFTRDWLADLARAWGSAPDV